MCLRIILGSLALCVACLGDLRARADDEPSVDIEARVPRAWLRNDPDRLPLEPARWRRRLPRRCQTRGGYREYCQGERRVPEPHGPAQALAERLGLGHRFTARILLSQPPLPEWIDAVQGDDPRQSLTFPVQEGRLGRGFGRVRRGSLRNRRHRGVDIGAPEGSPILAARGGLVAYSDDGLTGYGNVVILLHRDGFTTLYAHCRATRVFAGERVERGQLIAEVGETGFAYAPHLHFEWRQRGWVRDPGPHFMPRHAEIAEPPVPPPAASVAP
ncbi:MAG: M23 family metallopeptidase [Myxococcales bacterium]|nr:M23 family metallopeptidase [Myxococcales bacterium]